MSPFSRELLDYYLQEVDDLRTFLRAHAEEVRRARPEDPLPLDVADPDVQRLIEGIAFFTARTREVSTRNVRSAWQRLFQQYFDYLLNPLPTCGMVRIRPVSLTDRQQLPAGTRLLYTFEGGAQGYFQTAAPLTLLPLTVERVLRLDSPIRGQHRVMIELRLLNLWRGAIGQLHFFLNAFDEYRASLLLHHRLRSSLKKVLFFADSEDVQRQDDPRAQSRAYACGFSFGALELGTPAPEAPPPPPALEELRRFFHAPERGLYFKVQVPELTPRRDRCALVLELDERWPYKDLSPEFFQPMVVPVENIVRDNAQPMYFDGTRWSQPLLHPQDEQKLEPHTVLGVYRAGKPGAVPVLPQVLGTQEVGFDLEERLYQQRRRVELRYEDAQAALQPQLLTADVLWHQPQLQRARILRVMPYSRVLQGCAFEPVGELRLAVENPLRNSLEGLMQMLSLRMKTRLDKQELHTLLDGLGCFQQGPYQQLHHVLERVSSQLLPAQQLPNGGLKLRYLVGFARVDEALRPFLDVFLEKLGTLLSYWVGDEALEVEVFEAQSEDHALGGP